MQKLRALFKTKKSRYIAALVALILTASLYIQLGRDALFDWDEGIYAELGREMIISGEIWVPTWGGEVWFEKPPGIAWTTALGMNLFGVSEIGARALMPLFAGFSLYGIFLIGKKIKDSYVGIISMLVLANMQLFLARARGVNTDGPLLTGIIFTFYALLISANPIIVSIIVALSIWFKGLAGLLTLVLAAPLLMKKTKKYIFRLFSYLAVFTAPWHLFVWSKYGEVFLNPYLREQVVKRITTPIEFHLESKWYYFSFLYENIGAAFLFLTTVFITSTAVKYLKDRKLSNEVAVSWWILAPIVIFTLAKTKLFWYALPVYPAIALSIAILIRRIANHKRLLTILNIFIVLYSIQTVGNILKNVESTKSVALIPQHIQIASRLSNESDTLAVLVTKSERTAEAILPLDQRISSSFRYGGTPSILFYYKGTVKYFYNVDEFKSFWQDHGTRGLIHQSDLSKVGIPEEQRFILGDPYVGILKEELQ